MYSISSPKLSEFHIIEASTHFDEGSKKRKGSLIESYDDDNESVKLPKTPSDWNKRQNHSEIEKRRRDKMNTYIMELSSIIPVGTSRKLDKLTVLRMAVQHMRMLRGSINSYTKDHYKPAFLSDEELKKLIIQAADGFLFVVGCDRGQILYVSDSITQILQYGRSDLLGTSWFDILHPKDLTKVKEQLSSSDINRRERLVDAKTLLPVKADVPRELNHLCPGSRRSFFCRMRCKAVPTIKEEADVTAETCKRKSKLQCSDKRYNVIHFTGYLKSWSTPSESLDEDSTDGDGNNLLCLVAVGRVHQNLLASLRQEPSNMCCTVPYQPIEFVSRYTSDGKFVFIDLQATLILGWLPQELLGFSMYEFFHPDDITFLAETHRLTLQSSIPINTKVYQFRSKDGSFLRLRSTWRVFKNPWTKEIEYIISSNFVVRSEAGVIENSIESENISSQTLANYGNLINTPDDTTSPVTSSQLVGNGIQACTIGRKIADEVLDTRRRSVSPLNETISPLDSILDSTSDNSFADLFKDNSNNLTTCGSSSDISVDSDSAQKQRAFNHNKNLLASQAQRQVSSNCVRSSIESNSCTGSENDVMDIVSYRDLEKGVTSDSDEAAMAVIMSLLEQDAGLGGPVDFSHLPWPLP